MTTKKTGKTKEAAKEPKAAEAKGDKAGKKAKASKTFNTKAKGVKPLETFAQSFPVKLNAKEKDQRIVDHNKVWREIGALEMKKKVFTENLNAELKEKNADFDRLMSAMESGTEDREIRCGLFPVFSKNLVFTVRLDTEEIIGERTMTPDEKLKLMPKKAGTVTKLGIVKDENQVKADEKTARMKASVLPPETADGGTSKAELTDDEKQKKDDDNAWTEDD